MYIEGQLNSYNDAIEEIRRISPFLQERDLLVKIEKLPWGYDLQLIPRDVAMDIDITEFTPSLIDPRVGL